MRPDKTERAGNYARPLNLLTAVPAPLAPHRHVPLYHGLVWLNPPNPKSRIAAIVLHLCQV
jgi:hypothetical protein